MNLFDCEWVNNHFSIRKKTIALNNQFSLFPLMSNGNLLDMLFDFIFEASKVSKQSDKLFDLVEFENNDRHISFLGVKHLTPGNHGINDQILSSIDCFFKDSNIQIRNPIVFVENVEELMRENWDMVASSRCSRLAAFFQSVQIYTKRELPGESYFVVQKALEYGRLIFCPEPSRVSRIEAALERVLKPGDIFFEHVIFYEFLTNIHGKINAAQMDRLSYATGQLILNEFTAYISKIIIEFNEFNGAEFPIDVHNILKDLFDVFWLNSDIRLDELTCLLTPDIYSVTLSDSLHDVSDSVINDIRKVPTFIGQFRDFNIAREVYSALKHHNIMIVYGIGHLDTLFLSLKHIINLKE